MGLYYNKVLPWLIKKAMGTKELAPLRQKLLAQAHGTVVELGIGAGANIPYYPDRLDRLIGIDNHPEMVRRINIDERVRGKIEIRVSEASAVPVGNASADCVVSSFTLCSVTNTDSVLREVRRILKPEGKFIFLEHGLSDSHAVRRWQNLLTPLNRKIAGGCCLNLDYSTLLTRAGFRLDNIENFYLPKAPKTHGFLYQGTASKSVTI